MTDPIATALGAALGVTLYQLVKHLVVDGLRLRRKLIATRKQTELEQWRLSQRIGARTTLPSRAGSPGNLPYLGLDIDVPCFTERNRSK